MYHLCKDEAGNDFGWGKVLDYVGVGWEDKPWETTQINLFDDQQEEA